MTEKFECERDYCVFLNFLKDKNTSKDILDVWLAYCKNENLSKSCKRMEYLERNKKEAPENMSPTGRML